jgi:deoxyribodipyrimidine photolyase-related protein
VHGFKPAPRTKHYHQINNFYLKTINMTLIILPNQLFPLKLIKQKHNDLLNKIYLIEEPRFFTDFKYHKLKLVYHRASMKKYFDDLKKLKIDVTYIEYDKVNKDFYKKLNTDNTHYFRPGDHNVFDKFNKLIPKAHLIETLNFLLSADDINNNKNKFFTNNKYSHDLFYKFQRERLDILVKNQKPIGGKWSFDSDNRKPLPEGIKEPTLPKIKKDKYYKEAVKYVEDNFSDNYGSTDEWLYPIDTKSALKWFNFFLTKKLSKYGPYQDAVDTTKPFLFHSVISPMMNIGILPDIYVVKLSDEYYNKHKASIPIASYEGFIRQVIGWRNYVYSIYMLEKNMYEKNFLKHKNKIDEKYWLGNTGIKPIDSIIHNIQKYSYAHHIERLMYLGNWFLINQADPKEVHRIFMEWTIDAYDWVMTPNIMGMSQFADGGKMMTRIYFSSSNYIDKMSIFKRKKDEDWWKIWDAVYYSFINRHQDLLTKNYATSRQVAHWKKKSVKEKELLLELAKKFNF